MSRIAVVLFNLGGPDRPAAVRPFLKNLFLDPAIIRVPWPVRRLLAELISRSREKLAVANYAVMGGASPLLAETEAQAAALEARLGALRPDDEVRCFIAMRYWRPMAEETAAAVTRFAPDEVVLLPLYPQFSTTTTASSLKAWTQAYGGEPTRAVCCYFDQDALAAAHAALIERTWEAAGRPKPIRLLFSAHGLPERISAAGDPYRWQVEATCAKVAAQLGGGWDWQVCYQSRVGPLKWIGPSTLEAITAAGREGLGVLIDPIAFVSEHVETLVELDRDYAEAAKAAGVMSYLRTPALGTQPLFIDGLAALVEQALGRLGVAPGAGILSRTVRALRVARPRGSGGGPGMKHLVFYHNLLIGLHILAVIAWMAGLLYLPRLFAYHTRAAPGSEMDATFQIMEVKLLRIIMNPAAVAVWLLGLTLIWFDATQMQWGWRFLLTAWMLTKLAGVLFLTWWHHYLGKARRGFAVGRRDRAERFWRMTNELPFLTAIVMVLAITTKFAF